MRSRSRSQPVTRSTTLLPRSLIASTPATTAEPASFATSCATRVTRAIGAGTREALWRAVAALLADGRLPDAALRDDTVEALRFVLAERPLFDDAVERAEDALRELPAAPAAAADFPRDFVLFDLFLPPLRDEALLPDFPRDFLALVAIDALLGVVDGKTTPTIARIRHIRKSATNAHDDFRHRISQDLWSGGSASVRTSRCLASF